MPRHARQLADSGIYHVMLRGVNRDSIFLEDDDFERFLQILAITKDTSDCKVLAYCLMTNHIHLVVRTTREPIAIVMKRLGIRYAAWFNRKYGRVGHLFQDRFKSVPVETDEYFITLLRYVWANPVVAGIVTLPQDYRWSSRRLVGRRTDLVDSDEIERLLPSGGLLNVLAGSSPPADTVLMMRHASQRHTPDEVAHLVREICGANAPDDFEDLATSVRQRTVAELRTRGVPYSQIAAATGLSLYAIRRLHAAAG